MAIRVLFEWKTYLEVWKVLVATFNGFMDKKLLKMCASLSYYTMLSLAPLLLLLISISGSLFGEDAVRGLVFNEINGLIGPGAALQIQQTLQNMELSGQTNFAIIVSSITLFIGATTVFVDIQDSINTIWEVKAKPKKGWVKFIVNRLLSSSVIIGLGFLLIAILFVNGLLEVLNAWIRDFFSGSTAWFFRFFGYLINFFVLTLFFASIFKILPDAKIQWRDVRKGAFFTAAFFMLGSYFINLYISSSATGSAYGAAGTIIVILVWVYYIAAILYFGAEFTRVYAEFRGRKIAPSDIAVHVQQVEVEKNVKILPPTGQANSEKS